MNATHGWYYLHDNGELIYKPSPDAIVDIRESDLCRAAWPVDPSDRESAWDVLVESLSLGAKKERVLDLAETWKCDDSDAVHYAARVRCTIEQDGNQWCAKRKDFINLQESPAGFGDTALEAMADLCHQLGYKADKMGWSAKFKDLLKTEKEKKS